MSREKYLTARTTPVLLVLLLLGSLLVFIALAASAQTTKRTPRASPAANVK
jgi:hypothetical protein